jgi:hypothetical protein
MRPFLRPGLCLFQGTARRGRQGIRPYRAGIRLPGGVIPDDKAAQLAFLAPQLLLRSASAWAIADDPVLAITHHDR